MPPKPPVINVETPEQLFRRKKRAKLSWFKSIKRAHVIYVLASFLIIGIHAGMFTRPLGERLEHVALDALIRYRPAIPQDPQLVFIEIAEDGLQALGRWPWSRNYHAVLTHILNDWGAKAIVFDVIFSEPSDAANDGAFQEAIETSGRVYLPVVLESAGAEKIWIHSIPEFEEDSKGIGHINVTPDEDGKIRRIEPYLSSGETEYPHLALQVAFDALGEPVPDSESLPFALDRRGSLIVNWAGKWSSSFEHFSYLDMVKSYQAVQNGEAPLIAPERLKGKICLIGLTAMGHADIKATPIESVYPAIGIQASVINSFLTDRFIKPWPVRQNLAWIAGIGFFAMLLFFLARNVLALLVALGLSVLVGGTAFFMFVQHGIWIAVISPLVVIGSLFVFSMAHTLVANHFEQMRLLTLATQDGLTNLYVVRYFRVLLNQAGDQAVKRKQPLSLVMFDIDHFKNINDTYGHPAGDMVIRTLAGLAQEVTYGIYQKLKQAAVCRYGGEEFIILLKNCQLNRAQNDIAEPLRKKIEAHEFIWEGKRIPVTSSFGVTALRPDENTADPLVHRVDHALYQSKESGRNRVTVET